MTTAPPTESALSVRQSLAHGPLGTTLLSIERARRGTETWENVHRALSGLGPLIEGPDAGLYLGAPAMTFVLHQAAGGTERYAGALHTLDGIVAAHTRRRLTDAHARINAGRATTFAEYDLFRGLTGIGALLLQRQPRGPETKAVLDYLVRLTEPITAHGTPIPGWWVRHAPTTNQATMPGGHANAGLAHGITGPLALLALALRAGTTVDHHETAILRICRWLDEIRTHDHQGTHWPRWINQHGPAPTHHAAHSWCYGTPGLARAQQLAAIVTEDHDRKRMAERALLHCITDPTTLDRVATRGLCHGYGGILRTVLRVAEDSANPAAFTARTGLLANRFLTAGPPEDSGFLEGRTGAALAFQDAEPGGSTAPLQGQWDACLLLS
ncbi:lanthionine synthetase C family protein [Streptomyces sp. NBC_00669]|uniref:lanthionine synthetase C family protein n=1 Tax=Streptomyces sp. NBC_00669 TaxID=2976011 RepID=UPI002E33EBC9|nr:lanthionine synthetase C family protein [Streptomyces sp. NBC_00669]